MRHKKVEKRTTEGDRKYNNRLVAKFINRLMRDGKKTVSENTFYTAFEKIAKTGKDPLEVFEQALQNVGPRQEVRARRVGGASYQVPAEVRGERRTSLAIRWILTSAQARSSKEYHTLADKLSQELLDASQNQGAAIKRKDTAHRMAEANRAFSHFRW